MDPMNKSHHYNPHHHHQSQQQHQQQYQQHQQQQHNHYLPNYPTPGRKQQMSNDSCKDAYDLHAWSLFRQNLNANFSESALGFGSSAKAAAIASSDKAKNGGTGNGSVVNQSSANTTATTPTNNTANSNGTGSNFQLRESTVNNILSHPKYGAQLKNQDAFTYLRFGLPRVKATPSSVPVTSQGLSLTPDPTSEKKNDRNELASDQRKGVNGRVGVSAALNEELKRRFWSSDSNLLRTEFDSDSSGKEVHSSSNLPNSHHYHRQSPESKSLHHTSHQPYINRYHQNESKAAKNRHMKTNYSVTDLRNISQKMHPFADDKHSIHADNGRISSIGHDPGESNHHHHRMTRNSPYGIDNMDDDIRLDEVMSTGPGSLPPPLAKHPHLVVKDLMYEVDKSPIWRRVCGFSRQKLRILEEISFDVRSGELLAIMATSVMEGTALLNVLANRHDRRNGTVRAEIYLNGVTLSPRHLNRMVAYVSRTMQFCADMTPRQALLFAGLLMGPAARGSTDVKRRTRTLLEELNLGEVHHTRLSELTESERRRLHIAMHLIIDTEILILDQPLTGLDIFDAFFLVEYLRQWAMVGGKCVIMTMTPPTYEVFTMLNRVLLLSAGRSLFVGHRRDFMKYFTSLDFPCPPFKNPSDYYLDLVTLDDLSQEALLESSQRIENLAEIHARRPLVEMFSSMPGPPAVTPPPYRRANFAMQFLALWIRALIFTFPYNVVQLFIRFLLALTLSLIIGGIFWQVRSGREQEYVWDRIGFVHTMMSIGLIPLLIGDLRNVHNEKQYILSEVDQGFYSLPMYLVAKLLYSAPQSILIGLAYALPACSMAGLQHHTGPNSLPYYLLLMLVYYISLRSFVFATVWICKRKSTAICLFGLIFTLFILSSGTSIQLRDISFTHRWIRQISPVRWLHEALIGWEFEPHELSTSDGTIVSSFLCSRNPVIQQPNAILVRADCGFQTRANILKWFEYQGGNVTSNSTLRSPWHAFVALLILYLSSFVIGSIILCVRTYYYRDGVKLLNTDRT